MSRIRSSSYGGDQRDNESDFITNERDYEPIEDAVDSPFCAETEESTHNNDYILTDAYGATPMTPFTRSPV